MANPIALTMAVGQYDHFTDIKNGTVPIEGVSLTTLDLPVLEIFHRFINYREWDISEMSMAKYVSMRSQGDDSIIAIPVFPSRMFRQSAIWVKPGGPQHPSELRGARVGIPEWAQTAGVYVRGFLVEEYGVPLDSVEWVQAGLREPGRAEKVALRIPAGVRYRSEPNRSLQEMLNAGDLDAIVSADTPSNFENGSGEIKRMFDDPITVERDYWLKTRIYPIMHTIVIRKELVDRHPWLPMNVFKAFEESKRNSIARLRGTGASKVAVPWIQFYVRQAEELFGWGDDYWPYGVAANLETLETFLRWTFEQGVAHRKMNVEELFPPQLQTRVRV